MVLALVPVVLLSFAQWAAASTTTSATIQTTGTTSVTSSVSSRASQATTATSATTTTSVDVTTTASTTSATIQTTGTTPVTSSVSSRASQATTATSATTTTSVDVTTTASVAAPTTIASTMSTSTSAPSEAPLRGFGSHIEGASIDPAGNFYATHFRDTLDSSSKGNGVGRNVIGKRDLSTGNSSAYFVGEPNAVFNGMRWTATGDALFLADVGQGKVLRVDTSTMGSVDYCGSQEMRSVGVPNDLALSKNGFLYLSGQDWASSKGALWLCKPNGTDRGVAVLLEGDMGRTNGLALSPDDKTLYLTEANGSPVPNASYAEGQRIWKYSVNPDGSVGNKTLFYNFALDPVLPEADVDSDGMRTDVEGNLYVSRNGGSKIMVLSPEGRLVKEIKLSNVVSVTNMAFGGEAGSRIYAVGRCGSAAWGTGDGCLDIVSNDHAGREWAWFRSLSTSSSQTTTSPGHGELSSARRSMTAAFVTGLAVGLWHLLSL